MTRPPHAHLRSRIQRLNADRHFRDTQRSFPIYGARCVIQAVDANVPIETVLVETNRQSFNLRNRLQRICSAGVPIVRATSRRKSDCEYLDGIAAIVRKRKLELQDVKNASGCWIAVSRIRSPGNLGTLIRTVHAANARGVILIGQEIDAHCPAVVRASMGAFFRVPVFRVSWPTFLAWRNELDVDVVGVCPSGACSHWRDPFRQSTVFMLGEEGKGLSGRQRKSCRRLVRIPMVEAADSLNLGVAGSILVYEHARRFSDLR